MAVRLPIELFDLVAQYAAASTQANLSAVSRGVYFVSIRALYASISHMSTPRTTRCLLTLSTNPETARLVRSFTLRLSSSRVPRNFPDTLTRALGNMTGLTFLSLQLGIFATSSVMSQMSCRLTKLVCVLSSDDMYPISEFLSTQPAIEELYVVCRPDGLAGLGSDALPALRDLAAPLRLLPKLLLSRLSRLSRLSVLGTIAEIEDFIQLGTAFESATPPESIELVIGVDITAFLMTTEILAQGLGLLGLQAPFLRLLRLEIHRGHIRQDALQDVFMSALPEFPNLKTLVVMSQPPAPGAYIRKSPQVEPAQVLPSLSPAHDPPTNELSALSPRYLSPQPEYDEARNWPSSVPDALHDRSCHIKILSAWHKAHPGLERVVFPVGAYTYVNKGRRRDD
ncbi:hypothetical protein FRC11_014616 [Ceratobasidium sp. 423]|nr:hypothetical protein FRC11_014616 [Ceratobasidium sp. 423]